jgi:DNA-binding transcriptional regulator YdaS (Cro superfamily)
MAFTRVENMKHYTESDLRYALETVRRVTPLSKMAKDLGFSSPFISDVLAGRRPIGPKLAAALGYKKLLHCYVRK